MARILIAVLIPFLWAARSWAWEADVKRVDKRIRELGEARKKLKPEQIIEDVLKRARQKRKPDWTRKSYWKEKAYGRTYVFGVGLASGMSDRRLWVLAAENRARQSIGYIVGNVTTTTREEKGARVVKTSMDAKVKGSRVLDWYLEEGDKALYALAVEIIERDEDQ